MKTRLAAVVPFAALIGLKPRSERDDPEETEDEKAARLKAEEDEKKRKDEEEEEARRAEEKEKDEKAKKAKSDGDDDSDEGDDEKEKAARERERVRCARIVAFGLNNGCANQAGVLAFDTTLSSAQAISTLKASSMDGGPKRNTLASRMSTVNQPVVGAGNGQHAGQSSPAALAQQITEAANKARVR